MTKRHRAGSAMQHLQTHKISQKYQFFAFKPLKSKGTHGQ
jgi:hypothetical protein